jgi:hypothetical protein
MDAEYDVEYNYQYGQERGITLIVHPQKFYGEKPYNGKHRRSSKRIQQGGV